MARLLELTALRFEQKKTYIFLSLLARSSFDLQSCCDVPKGSAPGDAVQQISQSFVSNWTPKSNSARRARDASGAVAPLLRNLVQRQATLARP